MTGICWAIIYHVSNWYSTIKSSLMNYFCFAQSFSKEASQLTSFFSINTVVYLIEYYNTVDSLANGLNLL